jgi:hypothetical protein
MNNTPTVIAVFLFVFILYLLFLLQFRRNQLKYGASPEQTALFQQEGRSLAEWYIISAVATI